MSPADGLAWNEEAVGSIPTTLTNFNDPFAQSAESLSTKQVVAVRIRQGSPKLLWASHQGDGASLLTKNELGSIPRPAASCTTMVVVA
jgi:hypothetical protein